MSWLSLIVVFTIIWWLVVFMVLPTGLNAKTNEVGAPDKPGLLLKFIITTVISLALTALIYGLVVSGLLDMRSYLDGSLAAG